MALLLRNILVICFLCMQVTKAVINPLSISNPFYVEKGVNVVIPWSYTDNDKNVLLRRWYFTNISNPVANDFKQLVTISGSSNPKIVSSSPFKNIEVQKPATLIIKNPNKDHSGTYRVLITLNGGVDLTVSNVDVIITAVIKPLSIPNPFYVEKGVNVVIPWSYTDDDKDLIFRRWYFTNVSNPNFNDFEQLVIIFGTGNPKIVSSSPFQNIEVQKPATLIIKNPNKEHSGTYRFVITLNIGVDLPGSDVQVIITERPETEINCKVENDGNDISCDCSCIGGNPTPTATWYFKNVNIGGTGAPKNTLSLKNIKMADAGTYNCTCQSHNLKSGKEKKLFSPTNICFSSKKTKETVYVGQTVAITCETDGYPTPTYTLYHNGSQLTKNIVGGKYNIGKVKYDDAGLYKCVATNYLGNAFKSFELLVSADEIPLRFTTTLPPCDQTNCKGIAKTEPSGGSTQAYVIVLTFIGGTVFGMVLLYGIYLVRRWFLNRKNNPSNDQHSTHDYENADQEKNPTYQELDLSKMNEGENYQSLKMNSRSLKHNETPREKEVGYAELNQVRGNKDENYQSLNRV